MTAFKVMPASPPPPTLVKKKQIRLPCNTWVVIKQISFKCLLIWFDRYACWWLINLSANCVTGSDKSFDPRAPGVYFLNTLPRGEGNISCSHSGYEKGNRRRGRENRGKCDRQKKKDTIEKLKKKTKEKRDQKGMYGYVLCFRSTYILTL